MPVTVAKVTSVDHPVVPFADCWMMMTSSVRPENAETCR
jgi:hypothetical protein